MYCEDETTAGCNLFPNNRGHVGQTATRRDPPDGLGTGSGSWTGVFTHTQCERETRGPSFSTKAIPAHVTGSWQIFPGLFSFLSEAPNTCVKAVNLSSVLPDHSAFSALVLLKRDQGQRLEFQGRFQSMFVSALSFNANRCQGPAFSQPFALKPVGCVHSERHFPLTEATALLGYR